MGQGQDLEHPAIDDLLDDLLRRDRTEGVEHGLAPGRHLLRLGAGQVAELLAADGEERAEDDDLAMLAALEHGLESGAQRERGLAGAGAAAERHDADLGVEQQVEGDALLGAAAVQAERLAIAAHQSHLLVGRDAARARCRGRRAAPGRCGTAGRARLRGR